MIYQRRADTITAHQITTVEDAVLVTGWTPVEADGWAVASADGLLLSGEFGDYLVPAGSSWRVIPAAEFEAVWMLPPADWDAELAQITDALLGVADAITQMGAASTILGLRKPLLEVLPRLSVLGEAMAAILTTYRRSA